MDNSSQHNSKKGSIQYQDKRQYLTNFDEDQEQQENFDDQLVDNMMMAGSVFS